MTTKLDAVLYVDQATADRMERACQEPDDSLYRDDPIFDEEVRFSDGCRMAIQVIASTDPATESCWTQGVVFDDQGNELGCTDVGESFLGEFTVGKYTTVVVVR